MLTDAVGDNQVDKVFSSFVQEHGLLPELEPSGSAQQPKLDEKEARRKEDLNQALAANAKRMPYSLDRDFRQYLKASGEARAEFESLGRAYESQRQFKMKWLQAEFEAITKKQSYEEKQIETQVNTKTLKAILCFVFEA